MSLLQMSLFGTVMILAILIVRVFVVNKLPKRTFLILWELALWRLSLPCSIPSKFSAYTMMDKTIPAENTVREWLR